MQHSITLRTQSLNAESTYLHLPYSLIVQNKSSQLAPKRKKVIHLYTRIQKLISQKPPIFIFQYLSTALLSFILEAQITKSSIRTNQVHKSNHASVAAQL